MGGRSGAHLHLSAWNHAPADRKPPIVFVGRDRVFALLDPAKHPINFVAMPNSPDFDQTAFAMEKQGRTISRFDPERAQDKDRAPHRNEP